MSQTNLFSVCYILNEKEYIIHNSDDNISFIPQLIQLSAGDREIGLTLKNTSDGDIFLKYAVLWEAGQEADLAVGEGPYEIYRSGRHKNDMPGTFRTGVDDERLRDVLGAMTESGDKQDADGQSRSIVSDHLTVIQGSEKSLLVEFTGGRDQLFETIITLDKNYDFEKVQAKVIFNIFLSAGESVECEKVKLVRTKAVECEIESFAADKAAKYGTRCAKRPAVFCTWYYYGLTVTYEDVKTNLEIMKERKLPFDVFQIDEGWEITLGDWEANEKFPVPMKQVAEEIKQAGYRPGIWTSPFIAHESAPIWQEHPEWLLKDKDGNPCLFPMNDTIYQVLDITNPATCDYFRELYRKLTFDWGYTYHKLDFTRAAVIYEAADFYDKKITLAQSYYRAVKAIREGMGEDAYFLMCGGLYDPIIGLVDAQRTGSDVLSMWSSNINKNGKTAPYTIKQSVMRYYMNQWWDNDPDALMIRKNETMERDLRLTYGLLNDEEVKATVVNQFMSGGIMCATEPLDKITDDRLMEYRRILPVVPGVARSLKLMENSRFPGMVDVYMQDMDAHCLCVINWDDESELALELCIKDLLPGYVADSTEYVICDYYAGTYYTHVAADSVIKVKNIAPHGAGVYKVTKMQDKPIVVKSTGHYSMGGEFERLEMEAGELRYAVKNLFDVPIVYEVLCPDGERVLLEIAKGRHEA